MKIELEREDIQSIARSVLEALKPELSRLVGKSESDNTIFDVEGLAKYLKVKPKWIYENTHLLAIPHYKMGAFLRFRKREIDSWLNKHRAPDTQKPSALKGIKEATSV